VPAVAGSFTGSSVLAASVWSEYQRRLETESDIQGHMQFMHDTAWDAGGRVIELGVRSGNSTSAFLSAAQEHRDGLVFSVDTEPAMVPAEWHRHSYWVFRQDDDLGDAVMQTAKALIPHADVLFIDTSHAYMHTLRELRRWVPLVRPGGRVLMHDTEYDPTAYEVGGIPQPRLPVSVALTEFCAERGWHWVNRTGYNGMGVIQIPEAHGTRS
jgi:predicted O-methyltransferase YrrM